MTKSGWLASCALAWAAFATDAKADGYPPFYGFSPYFGSPAVTFSPDSDVEQATSERDTYFGFGTRKYYRGGPYWSYQPTSVHREDIDGRVRTTRSRRHRRTYARRG